jgi:nucleotide-binding universal stress UspA family protein
MSKFESIIVPLGGSPFAEQALPLARTIAATGRARLVLMRAHESAGLPLARAFAADSHSDAEAIRRESDYLAAVAAQSPHPGSADVETLVIRGRPPEAICQVAESHRGALIVMASHGRTGATRVRLGSVMDEVLHRAKTPVLAFRAAEDRAAAPPERIQKMLIPLDGSTTAEAILPHAVALAEACGAAIELLRVVIPDETVLAAAETAGDGGIAVARRDLHRVAARLRAEAPAVLVHTTVCLADTAAPIIAAAARLWNCDMVAMTTRASGLTRLVVGSTGDEIIRTGPPLLLLVRPDVR